MTIPQHLLTLGARPLLVILDYDGTLAPIVTRPEDAQPEPGAREVLERFAAHSCHRAAIVTGRRAEQVAAFLNIPDLAVVGLHGMEWPGEAITPPDTEAIAALHAQLPDTPGVRAEDKGWTLAVHYRETPDAQHEQVEQHLANVTLPDAWEVIKGKKVREFRPGGFGKGRAVQRLAQEAPGHLPVFIGDDVTDEEGFETLNALKGVTIKVGEGTTAAEHRVDSPAEVVQLLERWAQTHP